MLCPLPALDPVSHHFSKHSLPAIQRKRTKRASHIIDHKMMNRVMHDASVSQIQSNKVVEIDHKMMNRVMHDVSISQIQSNKVVEKENDSLPPGRLWVLG